MNLAKRFIFAALMIGMTLSVACNDDNQIRRDDGGKVDPNKDKNKNNKNTPQDQPKPKPYKAKAGFACGKLTPCDEGLKCVSVQGSSEIGVCRTTETCKNAASCNGNANGPSCLPFLVIEEGSKPAPEQPSQAGGSLAVYPGTHWEMVCGKCSKYTPCSSGSVCVRVDNNFDEGKCVATCSSVTQCPDQQTMDCRSAKSYERVVNGTANGNVCLTKEEQKGYLGQRCTKDAQCGEGMVCTTTTANLTYGECSLTCEKEGYVPEECNGPDRPENKKYCVNQWTVQAGDKPNKEVKACAKSPKKTVTEQYAECDLVNKFCAENMLCVKKKLEDSTGECVHTCTNNDPICGDGTCTDVDDPNLIMVGYPDSAKKVCSK